MFGQKFFPYSTLQELNLDWILTKVKNILRFVPDDGAVGQILRRTPDGAEWSNETGGGGAVNSVNGQTGDVVLDASDVGALPDSYTAPVTSVNNKTGAVSLTASDVGALPDSYTAPVNSVNGQTGDVVLDASDVGALPDSYTAPVTSVNTKTGAVVLDKTDIGLGNVSNVAQYSASNPPPYPVTSVNGQTGDVVVSGGTSGWGTPASITFPYTPTKDGFILGYIAPQSSGTSYMFITEEGTAWARASSYAGSGYGLSFPARNGKEYAIALSANISSQTFRFIPFA